MRLALLLAAVAGAILSGAGAQACEPTTSRATLTLHAAGGIGYYVVEDEGWLSCEFGFPECGSIWVYEESNGIPGVQRDDELRDDTCDGRIQGDTVVL